MKKLKSSSAIKIIAVILMTVLGLGLCTSLFGIADMIEDFDQYTLFPESQIYNNVMHYYARRAFNNYLYHKESLYNNLKVDNLNCYFTIVDETGRNIVFSNYTQSAVDVDDLAEFHTTYYDYRFEEKVKGYYIRDDYYEEPYYEPVETPYTIHMYLKDTLTSHNFVYYANRVFDMRYSLIILSIILFILVIILGVFLLSAAGHRSGTDEIVPSFIDRIPIDLLLVLCIGIVAIAYSIFYGIDYGNNILIGLFITVIYFLTVIFIMSFAVRCKLKTIWKNSIIYYVLYYLYIGGKWVWKKLRILFNSIPIIWKSGIVILAFLILNLFFLVLRVYFINVILILGAVLYILYFIISLNKIKIGAEKIALGDIHYKIDTSTMLFDLQSIGNDLNNISNGLANAVNERMRSEHFKSELITNVSHDIKTPLTSIINYVDLLKKEEIDNETITNYIDILERQSNKLKKLTEDLIDASKASTGNVSVNIAELDIIELLDQSIGEYSEKFAVINVMPIFNLHGIETFKIWSDGRLLWRVFDNLLNNIYKYAMNSTRIYIDVNVVNNSVMISMKNISRDPLNVSSDELMERFIRGDSSRTTDGSGLGLSISRSLIEILGGALNIFIDGDLFKVVIMIDIEQER